MAAKDHQHGRYATRPGQIPLRGWRDIAFRVKDELAEDNLSIIAAGVAFYAMLAIFPALAALVSVYGLIADPADLQRQLQAMSGVLPEEAQSILMDQLGEVVEGSQAALSFGLVGSLLLTLWSATKGVKAVITALNIVYDETERRGPFRMAALAMLFTLGAVVFGALTIGAVVILPGVLKWVGLGGSAELLVSLLRWPLLAVLLMFALAVIYRYGPSRREPQWRWVTWGSVAATCLWILASILFSLYVTNFGSYNKTYGSVGAVVILLMWFYLGAYIVLLGAEVNAEVEHQTKEDTTVGPARPLGKRGAYVADTVGVSHRSKG